MNTAIKNKEGGQGDFWGTPLDLWEEIKEQVLLVEKGTEVFDPCPSSVLLPGTWGTGKDGLVDEWQRAGKVFVNPPFSDIYPWIQKAYRYGKSSTSRVIMLLPVRTDQKWWHDYAMFASVVWIQGRVNYVNPQTQEAGKSPSFPSCLLVFDGMVRPPCSWWPACHRNRRKINAD